MSTRISSLSIRTTVPSTTSPCLKLLMSESCSASSSSIVVGSGPVRVGGAAPGASSSAAAAASARARRRVRGLVDRWRRRLGPSSAPIGLPRPPRRRGVPRARPRRASASPAASARRLVDGDCGVCVGRRLPSSGARLGASGSGVSVAAGSSATAIAATVSSDAGASLEAMASGGRRGPALLIFGQGDPVSCRGFGPWNHERRRAHARAVLDERGWIVVTLAGGPLLRWSIGLDDALQLSVPEGRESLARGFRGYNRRPCPNCPT